MCFCVFGDIGFGHLAQFFRTQESQVRIIDFNAFWLFAIDFVIETECGSAPEAVAIGPYGLWSFGPKDILMKKNIFFDLSLTAIAPLACILELSTISVIIKRDFG